MPTPVRQTSFSGGELSPLLYGRTDLEVFGRGLRKMRNFFASRHGAAVSRPGMTALGVPFGQPVPIQLIPFIYSDTQSYVLEFTRFWLRVWSYGTVVTTIPSPYNSTHLDKLQWTQSGDVLTLTHPLLEPRELRRTDHAAWAFSTVSFDRPAPTLSAYHLLKPNATQVEDATHPAREWKYMVTELRRTADTGVTYESKPVRVPNCADDAAGNNPETLPGRILRYPDKIQKLSLTSSYADVATDPNFLGYCVYCGIGDLMGFLGMTKEATFTDDGSEPDYARAPPLGQNPFKIYNGAGAEVRIEKPAAVTYFGSRLCFGGTAERPGWVFESAVEDYKNFDERLVVTADMAIMFDLASRTRQEIRSLVGLRRQLLVGTNAAWWAGVFNIEDVEFSVIDEVGTNRIPVPLVVENSVLYARTKGTGARALQFNDTGGGFQAIDLSFGAQHLFTGITKFADALANLPICSWTYAEDPWGVVWAARSDGKLLSLTYSPGQNVAAWALHETDGKVLAVCAVPEGNEDAVYLAVSRDTSAALGQVFIERMTSRVDAGSVADNICLDNARKYTMVPALEITGDDANGIPLSHFNGRADVWVVAKQTNGLQAWGPLAVAAGKLTLPDIPEANSGANVVLYVGLKFTPELETLDVAQASVRNKPKRVTAVGFEVDAGRGLWAGEDTEKDADGDYKHMHPWRQREVKHGYDAVPGATDYIEIPVSGTWNKGGRMILLQDEPLPVTCLGITRILDVGDDER